MNNIDFKKLGDYVKIKTGKLDANASSEDGEYPFFTCSIEPLKISSYSYDCECCLVAGNGDLNVKYYNGKFDAYQRTYIIESLDKEKLDVMYLYFFLSSYIEVLRKQSIGGVIKYIKLGNLTDALIPIPELSKQKEICQNLIKAKKILSSNENLLSKYDTLIKSRFIEMFGDPVQNPMRWEVYTVEECATKEPNSLKAGPFGSSLKKEFYVETGYKIYGQEQVISGDANFGDYYIDEKKFNELKSCEVKANDVLISLVGTYGKLLIIPQEFQKGIINPRLLKITFDKSKIDTVFFKYFFASDSLQKKLTDNTHGGTMGILNLGIVRKIKIPVPPISLQNDFKTFVHQIDKSKFAVQKSLEKAETLYKSLMQAYFG